MQTVFEVGEVVEAVYCQGYPLTLGKRYTVTRFEGPVAEAGCGGFVWPAYVTVVGDTGKPCVCHTHRFKKIGG